MVPALIGLLLALLVFAAVFVPVQRFRFDHAGRRYDLWNYVLHERLWADGVRLTATRAGGDYLTHVRHQIALPGDRVICLVLTPSGVGVQCVASLDGEVLFDSHEPTAPMLTEPTNPRWPAARALLSELAADRDPRIASAAVSLREELGLAMLRLEQARTVLDGTGLEWRPVGDEPSPWRIVARRQVAIEELLTVLRGLARAAGLGARSRAGRARDCPPLQGALGSGSKGPLKAGTHSVNSG
jgi:hypothetical protein